MANDVEKWRHGDLYDAHAPYFRNQKEIASRFLNTYNQTDYADTEIRTRLLKDNFGAVGDYVTVGTPFLCDFANNIYLGSKISINMNCSFMDSGKITIGDETMVAPNVQIYTGTHPVGATERLNPNWELHKNQHFVMTRSLPVKVGRRCWIGGGSIILPGVTIGDNTVIGGGSVVTKDIPANVVAVGNPCHVLRKIGADN